MGRSPFPCKPGVDSAASVQSLVPHAINAASHQAARIEEMLRAIAALGPAVARIEFDPQEISYFAEYTIFNLPRQFSVGIGEPDGASERDGPLHLYARAG